MAEIMINLQPRYISRFPAVTESSCRYRTLNWQVPLSQVALVALDIWDRDCHADMRARDDSVTRERIVPLVAACRAAGLLIVHAPSPPIAQRHPNWADRTAGEVPQAVWPRSPVWPPQEFRRKQQPYDGFIRPDDDDRAAAWAICDMAEFHPLVQPHGDEPVVATGEELHRLCTERQILHLLYVGFHTPGCMTGRSYGLTQMQARGYHIILLRDCTNGMESHETHANQTCMHSTITYLEQSGTYTMTSDELAAGLCERERKG